ncbi:MAG: hypothetical protein K2X82_12195 [Gemmataceae bacterium]|nr:hypothetical protein [Gemmataceae bacterium]
MTTHDVVILTTFTLVVVVSLTVVRLAFRAAPTPGAAVVGPAVFAVGGALAGIAAGMHWFPDRGGEWGTVSIDTGVPLAVCGAVAGAAVGLVAKAVYRRSPPLRAGLVVLTAAALGAGVGAPLGWIGAGRDARNGVEFKEHSTPRMARGAAVGTGIGAALGLATVLPRRRGAV